MKLKALISMLLAGCLAAACGIYSFTGTSIQPDVNTITIPYVEYRALRVNPALSNQMTEALQEKFRRLTRLEQVDVDGDLELVCEITGYDVKATAVTADELASQNRLTVTVKVNFTNNKYPEDNVENKSFSAYEDFDATLTLDSVEGGLCESIVDKLVEDIFNATVAQW
ncbi:MAG: LptE family protein [Bacteroidales bacterium]|nr:LptE family protein [Bacteroidales bacterium]